MLRLVRFAILTVLLATSDLAAQGTICRPTSDFQTCITALYAHICTDPPNTANRDKRCSDDWRTQWMTLRSYCTDPARTTEPVCQEFATRAAARLAFHHGNQPPAWEAIGVEKRTEFGLNKIPTVSVATKDHLIVVVDRTNPLLYAVTADAATSEKIDQIAQLQKLAGLFGGNIAQVLKGAEEKQIKSQGLTIADELDNVRLLLLDPALRLKCLTDAASAESTRTAPFIQAVEFGIPAEYPTDPATCGGTSLDSTSVVQALSDLDKQFTPLGCIDIADLKAALSGDPSKPADIQQSVTNFKTQASRCPFWQILVSGSAATRLQALMNEALDEIVAAGNDPVKMKTALSDAAATSQAVQLLGDAIDTTAGLSKDLAGLPKSVAALEDFRRQILRGAIGSTTACSSPAIGKNCIRSRQIVDFIVVDGVNGDDVSWQEIQTQPIKIAAAGDFAANVHPSLPTVSTSYRVQRASARAWDMGVSIVRTRIADPKFTAVDAPSSASITPSADTAATPKVIAQTGETTRTGEVALFGNVRPIALLYPDAPAWQRAFGLEVGSALSTDKPAVFGGFSVQLGPYVRVGWGFTSQRITELKGTTVGQPVASTDAIPTRQAFHKGHYASLSISLGTISLFTAPKE